MVLDLTLDVMVLCFNNVDIRVKVIDVVNQRVVLLLRLAECGHNLFVRTNACLFLDLIERVFDDLDIPHIHVHE